MPRLEETITYPSGRVVKIKFAPDIDEKIDEAIEYLKERRPGYFRLKKVEEYAERLKEAIKYNKDLILKYIAKTRELHPRGVPSSLNVCIVYPTPFMPKDTSESVMCVRFVPEKVSPNEYYVTILSYSPGFIGSLSAFEYLYRSAAIYFDTDELALRKELKEAIKELEEKRV